VQTLVIVAKSAQFDPYLFRIRWTTLLHYYATILWSLYRHGRK